MRVDVLGVGFDSLTLDQAVEEGMRLLHTPGAHYVVTPNPEIVETCRQDSAARQAVMFARLSARCRYGRQGAGCYADGMALWG